MMGLLWGVFPASCADIPSESFSHNDNQEPCFWQIIPATNVNGAIEENLAIKKFLKHGYQGSDTVLGGRCCRSTGKNHISA